MNRQTISNQIVSILRKELNLDNNFVLNFEKNLVEWFNLDSLMLVNILLALEKDPILKMNVANLIYEDLESLNTLIDFIICQTTSEEE
ncbi:phosphopantetheine-binding protein [Bacillus sp. 166amftsu]|uniref:phosphopantetheine-binding protein n=1 Tax=Bacillus sp. 166amftsu TaxID=1761753 RepID=UPI0008977835|nr:phosphopantetheine-binding protein [Bacillus sp. 166amftsu]SDZ37866.1 Phosphopantetheine attachment site [Bacillus sp. 166amftsu]